MHESKGSPLITPCVSGGWNSFDIVCQSVCVFVSPSNYPGWTGWGRDLKFNIIIYSTPYINDRATTRGVFKAYVFFFLLFIVSNTKYRKPQMQFHKFRTFFNKTLFIVHHYHAAHHDNVKDLGHIWLCYIRITPKTWDTWKWVLTFKCPDSIMNHLFCKCKALGCSLRHWKYILMIGTELMETDPHPCQSFPLALALLWVLMAGISRAAPTMEANPPR